MSRERNARGEGALLRKEILDAAVALLDEDDDAASLSLRGVARRAGISAPSIYAHFADLPDLIDAVLVRSFADLHASVRRAVARRRDEGPACALEAAGHSYVQFAWKHRARYRLMFSADGYAVNAIETFRLVQALVGECAADGAGHSVDTRTDTWMLWAGLHGVATLDKPARAEQRRLGPLDRPAMLRTMIHRLARISSDE